MLDLIRGLHTPPWVVGFARGALEAGLMALVGAVALYIVEDPRFVVIGPVVIWIERFLEGLIDQIDKSKKRAPGTG